MPEDTESKFKVGFTPWRSLSEEQVTDLAAALASVVQTFCLDRHIEVARPPWVSRWKQEYPAEESPPPPPPRGSTR